MGIVLFFGIFVGLILFVNAYQVNLDDYSTTNLTITRKSIHLNVSDSSLILYMPFDAYRNDGKTYDCTNNSNDGTLVNNPLFNSSGGYYGGAYKFDGVDDYVELDTRIPIENYSNWSVSAWIKYFDCEDSVCAILGGRIFHIQSSTNQLRYYDGSSHLSDSSILEGVWTHVSLTCDNSTGIGIFYINGIENGTESMDCDYSGYINYRTKYIGTYAGSSDYSFNGSIDEVMIFNRSLTSLEITDIYDASFERFLPSGEILFETINLSSQGNTFLNFYDCSSFNGSYIQGRINQGNWINFSGCEFNDSTFSENLENVNFTAKLISGPNNFYSPLIFAKHSVLGAFSFATELDLTWPPENYSDSYYGAGSNPTGNPIGGFIDYSRIVDISDATYYINTKEEFLFALNDAMPGEIIYINDSVALDFTDDDFVTINIENITIASGRGSNYSKGALIKKDIELYNGSETSYLFKVYNSNVRFTGLRFYGGDIDCNSEYQSAIFNQNRDDLDGKYSEIYLLSEGIASNSSNLEVDNCEFYGWRNTGIGLWDGAINNYIHHNYIHHNCHLGRGYGVALWDGNATALIEGNLLNHNKHSISSSYQNNSYEARYNIQLDEQIRQGFDRHGSPYNISGNYTIIHHNTAYSEYRRCIDYTDYVVGIGSPSFGMSQVYNNQFQCSLNNSIYTLYNTTYLYVPVENTFVFNNYVNSTYDLYDLVAIIDLNKTIVSINETILFNASESYATWGSIRYVEWDFADNTSLKYGSSITHSFSEAGRYLVKVTVSDAVGFLDSDYISILVLPENTSKTYLNFWMFENSLVDSPEYIQKIAMINNEIIWQQNFSDNVSGWKHINVEISESLFSEDQLNLSLGVRTIKNYTDPLYPTNHEVEMFEVYFDQITIFTSGEDLEGDGDFEHVDNHWLEINNESSSWTNELSWGRRINGQYSYKIAPVFRGNYTNGSFVGITKNFDLSNRTISKFSMGKGINIKDSVSSFNSLSFSGPYNSDYNLVALPEGIFRYFNGINNSIYKRDLLDLGDSFLIQFVANENKSEKPLIYLEENEDSLYVYLNSENKIFVEASDDDGNLVYSAYYDIPVPSYVVNNLFILLDGNFRIYLENESLNLIETGSYNLNFSSDVNITIGKKDDFYFEGLIGNFDMYDYFLSSKDISNITEEKRPFRIYTFNDGVANSNFLQDYSKNNKSNVLFVGDVGFYDSAEGKGFEFQDNSWIEIPFSNEEGNLLEGEFSLETKTKFNNVTIAQTAFDTGILKFFYSESHGLFYWIIRVNEASSFGYSAWNYYWGTRKIIEEIEFQDIILIKKNKILQSYSEGSFYFSSHEDENFTIDFDSTTNITIGDFSGEVDYFILHDRKLSSEEIELKSDLNYLTCVDSDGDGYGSWFGFGEVNDCTYSAIDCDDLNGDVNPGETEVRGNSIDENCDGVLLSALASSDSGSVSPGGGSGLTAKKSYNFTLDKDLIKVKIKQGESFREVVDLKNTGDGNLKVGISFEGINKFVLVPEENFTLTKDDSKRINFDFYAGENEIPGVYFGRIFIEGNGIKKIISVILEVEEKNPLFDLIIEVKNPEVSVGSKLKSNIDVINMGDFKHVDVLLYYAIRDYEGNVFVFKEESLAIKRELHLTRSLRVPKDIELGDYIFYANVSYGNITASGAESIKIVEKSPSIFERIISFFRELFEKLFSR